MTPLLKRQLVAVVQIVIQVTKLRYFSLNSYFVLYNFRCSTPDRTEAILINDIYSNIEYYEKKNILVIMVIAKN